VTQARLSMRKIKEVLRLHSLENIAMKSETTCTCSREMLLAEAHAKSHPSYFQ
jgi:hypothetical protein